MKELIIEMKWQQRIGKEFLWLKTFANQWKLLSWLNFIFILIINLMFISTLTTNKFNGEIQFTHEWQSMISNWVGLT